MWKQISINGQVSLDDPKEGTISRRHNGKNERIAQQGTWDDNLLRLIATTKIQPISHFITITLATARIKPIAKIDFITYRFPIETEYWCEYRKVRKSE